jgi:hypothetical protein
MPSVGGLTITIEAVPNSLPGGTGQSGSVVAKLVNVSMLPLDSEFLTLKSSDDQVATADRLQGRAKHVINISARPSAATALVGQLKQENIASWEAHQQGVANLTGEFRVMTRFGALLGTLDPATPVTVT